MKCNAWVRREPKLRSPYNSVHPGFFDDLRKHGEAWGQRRGASWAARGHAKQTQTVEALLAEFDAGGYSRCDGKIICEIEAEDEPIYGGTYARVAINYRCDTCENDYYPALPDDPETLAGWVTEHIARLP